MTSLWLDRPPIPSDTLDRDSYQLVVVGAGLTGLVTGLMAARRGRNVAIIEAREVGAVATGNTTGKLSLLQGTKLSRMRSLTAAAVVRAYVDGNRAGQEWLLAFCAEHDVPVQRRDAITYATADATQVRKARTEFDAARAAGLPVRWSDELPLPVPNVGGVVLPDQAQFDPMDVLEALAGQFRQAGGTLVTGVRVVGAGWGREPRLELSDGRHVAATDVVLATGAPVFDRGMYFAKLAPERSYCLAFDYDQAPEVMALSTEPSVRSMRDVPADGSAGRRLIVGGAGHPVGRTGSARAHGEQLRAWAHTHFPDAVETHQWSAQDYRSHDGVPYVGTLPRGRGHLYLATGYDKWGMTNAVMAALDLIGQLDGDKSSWAQPMRRRITGPRAAARAVRTLAEAGVAGASGLAGALAHGGRPESLPEGSGRVTRDGRRPVGSATVDGQTCRVVAVCSHLGGIVEWNDAEQSWDCPLHGSRFAADGEVLEGPATKPLRRLT